MSVVQLPNGRWRVQIRRKTLKLDELYDNEEDARAAEQEALDTHGKVGRGQTLWKLWERYTASTLFDDKADNTKRTERTHIKPVLEKLGDCTLEELEADTGAIYDYIDARRRAISPRTKKRYSTTTVRLEVAALSALVEFAKQRRLVRENFVSNISRPVGKPRSKRIAPIEQGRLKLFTTNSDPAVAKASRFLLLIRLLGCRPGELKELRVADTLLSAREVLFRDTKNGTDRRVHLTAEAAGLLEWQLLDVHPGSDYVFASWSPRQQRWVPYNYASGINLLRELKIIDEATHAHAGRREFISRAVEAGVPLLTIKHNTGHKSTQALEVYDNALSVAPEMRNTLDAHAATVSAETLMGALDAAGMTAEQRQKVLENMGMSGWVNPFKEKERKLRNGY